MLRNTRMERPTSCTASRSPLPKRAGTQLTAAVDRPAFTATGRLNHTTQHRETLPSPNATTGVAFVHVGQYQQEVVPLLHRKVPIPRPTTQPSREAAAKGKPVAMVHRVHAVRKSVRGKAGKLHQHAQCRGRYSRLRCQQHTDGE